MRDGVSVEKESLVMDKLLEIQYLKIYINRRGEGIIRRRKSERR